MTGGTEIGASVVANRAKHVSRRSPRISPGQTPLHPPTRQPTNPPTCQLAKSLVPYPQCSARRDFRLPMLLVRSIVDTALENWRKPRIDFGDSCFGGYLSQSSRAGRASGLARRSVVERLKVRRQRRDHRRRHAKKLCHGIGVAIREPNVACAIDRNALRPIEILLDAVRVVN